MIIEGTIRGDRGTPGEVRGRSGGDWAGLNRWGRSRKLWAMTLKRGWLYLVAVLTVLPTTGLPGDGFGVFPGPAVARADTRDDADDVMDAAVLLLSQSIVVDRRGRHNLLLKAIRHLSDPASRPLFEYLADSDHPGLKIHGILGLAESSPDKKVDLSLIAQIQDPMVQSTVITAAMDGDLLDHEQAKQLLGWDGLAQEVKVLVAIRLVRDGEFSDTALLREAMGNAKKLGGSALAALLLLELDDPAGLEYLRTVVDTSDDPQRDTVRVMLLQTALKNEFNRIAPWALDIAKEPGVDPILQLLALRTALRFGEPGAVAFWQRRYDQAGNSPASRIRLALTALYLAPWLEPDIFEVLKQDADPMLAAIGEAGLQIATGSPQAADSVAALLEFGHPMVNAWALSYASDQASDVDSQVILLGLILAYEHSPQRGKARRLDEAVQAAQALYERDPQAGVKLLRPLLMDPSTDKLLTQAILLGLIRTRSADALDVVDGIEDQLNNIDALGLALLLRARSDQPMDGKQMADLSMIARGGSRLEDSLRIQAAWLYLKRTGQAQQALDRVLGNATP